MHAGGAERRKWLPAIVKTGLRLNAVVTVLFVIAGHLLAPFASPDFVEPGPVLAQAARNRAYRRLEHGAVRMDNVLVRAMHASTERSHQRA